MNPAGKPVAESAQRTPPAVRKAGDGARGRNAGNGARDGHADTTARGRNAGAGARDGDAGTAGRRRNAIPGPVTDVLSWLNGPAPGAARRAHGFVLTRRWLVTCFAVFTAYAGAMVFTDGRDGAWARWAVVGYAVAAVVAWCSRRVELPLLVALAGGLVAPTVWLILRAPATPDVVVVTQSARQLLHHGSPYLPAGQLTTVTSYNPYLPAMAIFGLPGAAGLPGLIGDTRLWLIAVSGVLLAASFWVAAPHWAAGEPAAREPAAHEPAAHEPAAPDQATPGGGARCRSCAAAAAWGAVFVVGSPVLALSLAVGITDAPIIALVCLALACVSAAAGGPGATGIRATGVRVAGVASGRQARLLAVAGLAVGVACALKFTAWPALPVIAAMLAARDGARAAIRFAGVSVVTAVVLVAAFAPALLAQPGTLVQNVILFPLGLTPHKTPAASPVPGHVLAGLGPAGHVAAVALLIAAGLAVAAWLVVRPPHSAAAALVRLAIGLALLFALAPASRFGYFAYPIALLGWLAMVWPAWSPASPAETTAATAAADPAR